MALPIASIPVLTGEVAQRFETEAQVNYQRNLNRTEQEKKAEVEALERGFAKLRRILNNAHLGNAIADITDDVFEISEVSDSLFQKIVSIPEHLLAYRITVHKGCNVDISRNLAKSVTVE